MYANGYDITLALAALQGRLGWSDTTLSTANKQSNSGRYFDDGSFHGMVNIGVIKSVLNPPDINTFLASRQTAILHRCLQGVFNEPQYKEQVYLYDRFNQLEQLIDNTGNCTGYRIDVKKDFDTTIQLKQAVLYFDQDVTFNLYLFKEGTTAALKTLPVTAAAHNRTVVDLTDWILNYKQASTYYVVYFQSELGTARAIQEIASYNNTFNFSAIPFFADTTGLSFSRVWQSISMMPRGLNLQADAFRDYTQDIQRQSYLFDEAIGMSMAENLLEAMFYTDNSNASERNMKELFKATINLQLQGTLPVPDSPQVQSLRTKITNELARIKEAFQPKSNPLSVSLCS